jgi:hypothetical protein
MKEAAMNRMTRTVLIPIVIAAFLASCSKTAVYFSPLEKPMGLLKFLPSFTNMDLDEVTCRY